MTDEIKRQAQHLHDQKGYRVLVPDLYKGKIGVDAEEAGHVGHSFGTLQHLIPPHAVCIDMLILARVQQSRSAHAGSLVTAVTHMAYTRSACCQVAFLAIALLPRVTASQSTVAAQTCSTAAHIQTNSSKMSLAVFLPASIDVRSAA